MQGHKYCLGKIFSDPICTKFQNSKKKKMMNKKISLIKIMYNGYMSNKYRNMPCIHPTKNDPAAQP